jgi:MFS transporter, OFA family, oxalate/formate antiporter
LLKLTNDSFLTVVGSCGAIFNGLGRFFWGFMLDRFSFRAISSLINALLMVAAVTASLAVQNDYCFLVAVSVIYFCYGGNYAVYPTQTMRVFGQELGGKVYYLVFSGFSFGTGCVS